MFYALSDNQTGRVMCTGCNSTSIQDLAKEYLEYIGIDYDEEEDADLIEILKGSDADRIKAVITANDFVVLESDVPFDEEA